jgi:hypothetical protein
MYAYGKPSAEKFHTGRGPDNQNSTSTVGAGLELKKTTGTSHTDDVIPKIKWRGAVSSIQPIKNIILSEREKFYIFKVGGSVFIWSSGL